MQPELPLPALQKPGFEDDFVRFYNSHIGTACDGSGLDLKFQDAYGDLTLCNGIVKTENGEISCTIDIRFACHIKHRADLYHVSEQTGRLGWIPLKSRL